MTQSFTRPDPVALPILLALPLVLGLGALVLPGSATHGLQLFRAAMLAAVGALPLVIWALGRRFGGRRRIVLRNAAVRMSAPSGNAERDIPYSTIRSVRVDPKNDLVLVLVEGEEVRVRLHRAADAAKLIQEKVDEQGYR